MLLLGTVVGILADKRVDLPVVAWIVAVAAGLVGTWAGTALGPARLASISLFMSVAATAGVRHHGYWNWYRSDDVMGRAATDLIEARPVCVRGIALETAQWAAADGAGGAAGWASQRSTFRLQLTHAQHGAGWDQATGVARVSVQQGIPTVVPMGFFQCWGRLVTPSPPRNPGQLDRAEMARGRRQGAILIVPNVACITACPQRVDRPLVAFARRQVLRCRARWQTALQRHVPAKSAALARTLILGQRGQLDPSVYDTFARSGAVHVLAVSGLHVGIAVWPLIAYLRRRLLGYRWLTWTTLAAAIVYAAITFAAAPVIRATVLLSTLCLGWLNHRRPAPIQSLALAAVVVLWWNPCQLFRTGAHLSFAAVAALMLVTPRVRLGPCEEPLERWLWKHRTRMQTLRRYLVLNILRLLVASSTVWLVTQPLVIDTNHLFTPVAPLVGAAVCIPLAGALYAGFGVCLLDPLWPGAAAMCGHLCRECLSLMVAGVTWAENLPGGHLYVPSPGSLWNLAFFALLAILMVWTPCRERKPLVIAALAVHLAIFVLVGLHWRTLRDNRSTRCTFLSVGHGACVVLEMPDGRCAVYDCGRLGNARWGSHLVAQFLWSRGIWRIDHVVISHADLDHYNMLAELTERFFIGEVVGSPFLWESPAAPLTQLQRRLADCGIPRRSASRGDFLWRTRHSRARVLHPGTVRGPGSDNAHSLVLYVRSGRHSVLLPGDLEEPGLSELTNGTRVTANVVLAPHHGSPSSRPTEFASWAQSQLLVVSGRRHAHRTVQTSLKAPPGLLHLHTDRHGAVTVQWRPEPGGPLMVEAFRLTDTRFVLPNRQKWHQPAESLPDDRRIDHPKR